MDFFDCVYPARNGRHGHAYTNFGKMNLLNAKYELDDRPLDPMCDCPVCSGVGAEEWETPIEAERALSDENLAKCTAVVRGDEAYP